MRVIGEVERTRPLSRADFERRYERSDRPVVIEGGAAEWRVSMGRPDISTTDILRPAIGDAFR